MKTTIQLQGIGKKYPLIKHLGKDIKNNFQDFWALKDISLETYEGQILGIIGRNGAGKTTLLNIIAGVLSPTQGNIAINGRVLGLFNLGAGFQDEMTGRENIFLNGAIIGATRKELEHKLSDIIEFSELGNFINMPLGAYSQGMRLRLAFSIIVNLDFDILVIDEVLAVGDALFQSKCFQRIMDFKRSGKTLIITTQSMELIQRLCDRVALLDHSQILFHGEVAEGINKYLTLLNTEKFFVGPMLQNTSLIENTKKWAEDKFNWGKKFGTKEAIIESVEFIDKFGFRCNKIRTREPLKIKVHLRVKNSIKNIHFGVAIFRLDGVYCYGPNTFFDGYKIYELKPGRGWFILNYKELLLAPGEYRISVGIWDENETLAFDYHNGYYPLIIEGYNNKNGELLNIPFKIEPKEAIYRIFFLRKNIKYIPNFSLLQGEKNLYKEIEGIEIESIKILNSLGEEKYQFMTNEAVTFVISFGKLKIRSNNLYLWLGIYREEGIYCEGAVVSLGNSKNFKLLFPKFPLLPGPYTASFGIYNIKEKKFLMSHLNYHFRMIFNQQDHGTICLEHSWRWMFPA